MRIARDRVVELDYTIRLGNGKMVETSVSEDGGPLVYLHGRAQLVPGVERAIEGAEAGDVMEVEVAPQDAYGMRDPAGVFVVPRSVFPANEEVGPGMSFSASRGDGKTVVFQVVAANGEMVVIDTNHPLAGETLHVSIAVRAVRAATDEELAAGKARRQEEHASPLIS